MTLVLITSLAIPTRYYPGITRLVLLGRSRGFLLTVDFDQDRLDDGRFSFSKELPAVFRSMPSGYCAMNWGRHVRLDK